MLVEQLDKTLPHRAGSAENTNWNFLIHLKFKSYQSEPAGWAALNMAGLSGRRRQAFSFYHVFLDEDRHQCGGGYGNQSAQNTAQRSAQGQRDDHRQRREVERGLHDARRKKAAFKLLVHSIKNDHAHEFMRRVKGGRGGGDGQRAQRSHNGHNVGNTGIERKHIEILEMQKIKDAQAGEPQTGHQDRLANEPVPHAALRADQSGGQTLLLPQGEERNGPVIGAFAINHKIDGQNNAHEKAEDSPGNIQEQAAGVAYDCRGVFLQSIGTEPVAQRQALKALGKFGQAVGPVLGEGAGIAVDGWRRENHEQRNPQGHSQHQQQNGQSPTRTPAAKADTANHTNRG